MNYNIKVKGEIHPQGTSESYTIDLKVKEVDSKKEALEIREKLQQALGQEELEFEPATPTKQVS